MTKNATEIPPQKKTHNFASSQVLLSKRIPTKTEAGDVWPIQPLGGSWSFWKLLPAWDPYMADVSCKIDGCAYNVSMIYSICVCIYYITSIVFRFTACYAVTMIWNTFLCGSFSGAPAHCNQPLSSWLSSFRVSKLLVLELQTRFSLVPYTTLTQWEKFLRKWGSGGIPNSYEALTRNTKHPWPPKKHIQSTCSNTWFPDLPGEPSETWHLGNLRNPRNLLFGVPETPKGYPCWGKDSLKQKEKSLTYQEKG